MSADKPPDSSVMSRDDILKFPFPYKLWIAISLPSGTFLHWNSDGTKIQINLWRLQEYLHSSHSIFVIKTNTKFLEHLENFQFVRDPDLSDSSIEVCYQHNNFQRHRLDLVGKIRRVTFFNLDNAQKAELEAGAAPSTNQFASRMRGDLCFMEHGYLTELQKKRIESEVLFAFTRETKVLQEKLKKAEQKINVNSNGKRGRSACLEREQVVILPKELYENPYDSVLAGKGGFQGYRYGGYYGNCTVEQIEKFFGDYLPKYSEGGILKVKNFKESGKNHSQTRKLPEETNVTDSSLPIEEPTVSVMEVDDKNVMEVDKFTTVNAIEVPNLTAPPNINISASFNNGAVEYNITEYRTDNIIMPSYKEVNLTSLNSLNEINSPIVQAVATPAPSQQHEENTDFYDDLRATFELLQNQSF